MAEGEGILYIMYLENITQGTGYMWDLEIGWYEGEPQAETDDNLRLYAVVTNTGEVEDLIYSEFDSIDVVPNEELLQFESLPINISFESIWTFIMPPNNVDITVNAGHWRELWSEPGDGSEPG